MNQLILFPALLFGEEISFAPELFLTSEGSLFVNNWGI